jgi:hypothetical protein
MANSVRLHGPNAGVLYMGEYYAVRAARCAGTPAHAAAQWLRVQHAAWLADVHPRERSVEVNFGLQCEVPNLPCLAEEPDVPTLPGWDYVTRWIFKRNKVHAGMRDSLLTLVQSPFNSSSASAQLAALAVDADRVAMYAYALVFDIVVENVVDNDTVMLSIWMNRGRAEGDFMKENRVEQPFSSTISVSTNTRSARVGPWYATPRDKVRLFLEIVLILAYAFLFAKMCRDAHTAFKFSALGPFVLRHLLDLSCVGCGLLNIGVLFVKVAAGPQAKLPSGTWPTTTTQWDSMDYMAYQMASVSVVGSWVLVCLGIRILGYAGCHHRLGIYHRLFKFALGELTEFAIFVFYALVVIGSAWTWTCMVRACTFAASRARHPSCDRRPAPPSRSTLADPTAAAHPVMTVVRLEPRVCVLQRWPAEHRAADVWLLLVRHLLAELQVARLRDSVALWPGCVLDHCARSCAGGTEHRHRHHWGGLRHRKGGQAAR